MFNVNEFDNSSSPNRIHIKYTKHSPNNVENKLYSLNDEDSKLIKDICIKNIPFWNNVNYDDIEITLKSNSVSNLVFIVKLICSNNKIYPNRTVVLKKRTSYSNVIYDREHQCDVAQLLGDNGLGPRVIGRFSDFTIQEFIEGTFMDASSFQNLSVITSLASSLAKFHKKGTEISPADWDRTPLVFRQINKWSDQVKRIIKKHHLDFDFDELQSSFEIYKTLLENHIKTSNSFSDFTIQEYVEGTIMDTISFQNLSVITSIASSLAKFHKKGTEISPADWDRTPLVFRQINKWSQHVERIIKKHNLDFDFDQLQSSFEIYKTILENHIKTSNSEHQCDVAQLLGDNGLGPRVIGRFSDFTIQEFIEGTFMDASSFQNLSVITSLASSLAKFHKKGTEISPADWDRTPLVFRQINKWSQHVERIIKKHHLDFDFDELQSSFEIYKTLLENHIKTSNSEHQCDVAQLLGDNGLGPRVIGRFSDFTIQEFIEGTIMDTKSFQNLSVITSLASSLAKFHKKGTEISPADWDRTPLVFRQINKWSDQVKRIIKKHDLDFDFDDLQSSYEKYKNLLENHIKTSNSLANSILFCHNDLYSENIISFQQGLYLIDFDYAGFNYVGWDISSFFGKIGFIYNVSTFPYFSYDKKAEPTDEFKSIFVSIYLSQLLNKNVSPSDNVVKEFLYSVEVHRLGVQLYWSFWGIIMTDSPSDEFAAPCHFSTQSKFHLESFDLLNLEVYKKFQDQNGDVSELK
ncbi:choline kinase [Theileria orientalis]|uniref:ethanolamine kinase n=1 Tax=Theileria orientalis TaxID=68886 RepID=A0A976MC38_THEOR|nr:choline kinase [Theileria orientalis]